jgi:large repetitive protein
LARGAAVHDRGDTLIEILVTVAIVSIAVVALLGGVLATTTASAAGRNTTTVDTVLKSFAETARYNIQTQAPDGSSGPQFFPCASASDYKVISAPYPSSGPTGSVVTVFATGFSPSVGTPVTFTATANSSVTGSTVITASSGDQAGAMVTFSVPALQPGSYTIAPFGTHDLAASNFTVSGGTPSNAVAFEGYQLSASIEYWSGSGWVPSGCSPNDLNSNLQQLTYRLIDTQTGNGASNSTSFVVADFTPLPVPTLVVSCSVGTHPGGPACDSSAYGLGTKFTFSATLSGFSNLTGTITWTGIPTGDGCGTPQNVPPLTVTCTITGLAGPLGPVGAVYSGDPVHSGVAALLGTSITVNSGSIVVDVTNSGSPVPSPANLLTFTVSVSGIVPGVTPTNQLQLNLATNVPNNYSSTDCSGTVALTGNSPPPAVTCYVHGATGGSYQVTATYPSDANYSGSSSSSTVIVLFPGAPTITYSPPVPTVGNQLTFTATITQPAGAPAPTGTITWTGTNLPASCTAAPMALPAASPYSVTCTVPQASRSVYSATATYSGDANYAGGSASITAPIALYAATPVLTCNHCALRHPGGTFTVTVTITPPAGAPTPSGTISWTVSGNATSCTGGSSTNLPPAPGPYTATCTISNDARGNYQFTATYSGDQNYAQETSAVLSEHVR